MAKQNNNRNTNNDSKNGDTKNPVVENKPVVDEKTKETFNVKKVESDEKEESTGDIFKLTSNTIFKDKTVVENVKLKDAWGRK